MSIVIVLFNLKTGVSHSEYEAWARGTDLPIVNALASVERFSILKATGRLDGGKSPYEYIEILELHSLAALGEDAKSDTMRKVAGEFQRFADGPVFITTESLQ